MDNGDNHQQRCRPVEERAVELAKAIHRDDSKGKREKKEHRGGDVGISDDDDAPSFAVG